MELESDYLQRMLLSRSLFYYTIRPLNAVLFLFYDLIKCLDECLIVYNYENPTLCVKISNRTASGCHLEIDTYVSCINDKLNLYIFFQSGLKEANRNKKKHYFSLISIFKRVLSF